MYSKKGVVYKLHAGWFINRTPGEFVNWGHQKIDWKRGKDPHPQYKSQHLDFTKDGRPPYKKTPPPCVFYHKMSVVRPFSVLSEAEIGL